jgi:hypothetical protein
MCTVKEHERLKDLDSELIKKYGNAQVIESCYHSFMDLSAIKVIAKIPPTNDWSLYEVKGFTVCNLNSSEATFIKVPKHYVKTSSICGIKVIQNFYVPATCLGETMELFTDVQKRINRNGLVAYVINYYKVPTEMKKGRAIKLKIGTPKRYPKEVKRIPLSNNMAITFVDL